MNHVKNIDQEMNQSQKHKYGSSRHEAIVEYLMQMLRAPQCNDHRSRKVTANTRT